MWSLDLTWQYSQDLEAVKKTSNAKEGNIYLQKH